MAKLWPSAWKGIALKYKASLYREIDKNRELTRELAVLRATTRMDAHIEKRVVAAILSAPRTGISFGVGRSAPEGEGLLSFGLLPLASILEWSTPAVLLLLAAALFLIWKNWPNRK